MLAAAAIARSAWSELGTGAPKTAITESPTYCMTVPPSARMAPFISARWRLSWPARADGSVVLGDARIAPDVGHQHGDLEPFGVADAPPALDEPLREPARQQPAQGLAVLLALDDGLLKPPQPAQGAVLTARHALGEPDEQPLDLLGHGGGGDLAGGGDRLDRLALGHQREQRLVVGPEVGGGLTGFTRAFTTTGSSIEPPVATSRMARASWSPSATRSFNR